MPDPTHRARVCADLREPLHREEGGQRVPPEAPTVSAQRAPREQDCDGGGSGPDLGRHARPSQSCSLGARENKIATGAGADRISEGMRAAFGAPVGTAARVKPGTKVFTISTTEDHVDDAKEALRKGGVKLPTPWRLEIEREKER